MKRTFQVGEWKFGEGKPKICVPIVEETQDAIWAKAKEISTLGVEVVEWRADFYRDVFSRDAVVTTLKGLKERLREKALLFTFRTKQEGGNQELEAERYYELNQTAAAYADFVDVEAFFEREKTAVEVKKLQELGAKVFLSNHDFEKTVSEEEIVQRLHWMQEQGADVAKIALMPNSKKDVFTLLSATQRAAELLEIPIVTMSMGKLGILSRISGAFTGSAMTFASLGKTSAPGQIPVADMQHFLEIL